MPRYHFYIHDGVHPLDEEDIDLPDLETARNEAVRLAGGMLLDQASLVHEQRGWHLSVRDAKGKPLVRVDVNVVNLMALQ